MVNMFHRFKSESSASSTRRRFVFGPLIAVMILFAFVLALSTGFFGVLSKEIPQSCTWHRDENLELKLVHVIFRHGARTPADTYPKDPYVNEKFTPYGWGQLTNVGRREMFELGETLRSRYNEFLGNQLNLNDVHAQCTGVSRTKMSIQLVLAGLFPPKNTGLEWNKNINWQPIPYDYQELDKDSLLLVRTPCPRFFEALEEVMNKGEVKNFLDDNASLFKRLENITEWNFKTPDEVQSLYSTLKAEEEYGLRLPEWTKEFYPKGMQEITDKSYIFNAYNSELKRLKGGVFLKKAISDWKKKLNKEIKQKIFVYAGHDATVTNILSAFNVWEQQFPNYGITAVLEFSQHKETKQYGVEIFLRNSTKENPQQLTIPGCKKFCPLDELEILLNENIPKDLESECKAKNENFTPPPPGGP